jgi:hypothetical protein
MLYNIYMKIFKIISITIGVVMGISLLFPWSPTRSVISKFIMDKENVFEKISFNGDCRYYKPRTLLGKSNPQYQCISYEYQTREKYLENIQKMQDSLKNDGWVFSEKHNFNQYDVTYFKDNLKLVIQPDGKKDSELKIFIAYTHLSYK